MIFGVGIAIALVLGLIVGIIFLNFGIQAGDGNVQANFGERFVTILIMGIEMGFIPVIGIFLAIRTLARRHDMIYGKATIAFLVWNFLTSLVVGVVILLVVMASLYDFVASYYL
jgi:Na+/H+-dicarboxylate symporter